MTIQEAIKDGKSVGNWCVAKYEPTSVDVDFYTNDGRTDQTQLDLYSDNIEEELSDLWDSLYEELNSDRENIISVYAYGYILD